MNKAAALVEALRGRKVRMAEWPAHEFFEYSNGAFRGYDGGLVHAHLIDDGEFEVFQAERPEFTCKYCGSPSYVDPSDQSPPPDYCHEPDHGEPTPVATVNMEFDTPEGAIVLPFGYGILSIARGVSTDGSFLIGVEFADNRGEVGEITLIGAEGFQPSVELSFPTEEQRDRVFQAFSPVDEQPEEHAFAYFVSGPGSETLCRCCNYLIHKRGGHMEMSDLIKRIDESVVAWRNYQLSVLLDDCKAEIIKLSHTKNALGHACALVEDELAKSKSEIQRLLLANETLVALNAEYAERIKVLLDEIDELSPSHVNEEYGCTHSDTLIMYHACDIKAILDKCRSEK